MSSTSIRKIVALSALAGPAVALLIALPAGDAEAQVRRSGGGSGAARAQPPAQRPAAAQRPATGRPGTVPGQGRVPGAGQGGNQVGGGNTATGGSRVNSGNTVGGGTRVQGGSNVAIGNDINVVRPPAGGGYPPAAQRPVGAVPPGYRPPVAVPVYPSYGYRPPTAGTVIAAGVVAGATAGVVAGAMQQPSSTVVIAPAAPTGSATLTPGMRLAVLPAGCTAQVVATIGYYRCSTAWLRPMMQGSQVFYEVVPTP